ncbi:unnamed protein product [Angiostrongylus costaricensis]|uniref:Pept_C1 domain-containing protein n=1 Tax=Angiostrongylus costaricensis TaxID=334426 RepID=A0A0R3PHY4_ANGCS|nr:unnamed protein product [Angiostrongylus costaricensis]
MFKCRFSYSGRLIRGTEHLKGKDLVEYVNKAQKLFTARLSPRFANVPDDIKRRIMGSLHVAVPAKYRANEKRHDDIDDSIIPSSFDARNSWSECPSLHSIRDQSNCGSCWAVAAAAAITDRICIASKGNTSVTISADDLLSCCTDCGFGVTVSLQTGCKPYPFPPCEHHIKPVHYKQCQGELYPTNACERSCQEGYAVPYEEDKHYGSSSYAVAADVATIQKEIMLHGPVEASFEVYGDFVHYSSGIYRLTGGDILGGHAVKMIGWGTENGVDYWLCANSWNTDWGENGKPSSPPSRISPRFLFTHENIRNPRFFRIRRGTDECGIESGVVAGLPK